MGIKGAINKSRSEKVAKALVKEVITEPKISEFAEQIKQERVDKFAEFVVDAMDWLTEHQEPTLSESVLLMAENLSVDQGFIPPHWVGVLFCDKCGAMPSPVENDGEKLASCPWCHSIVGAKLQKLVAEAEVSTLQTWGIKDEAVQRLKRREGNDVI